MKTLKCGLGTGQFLVMEVSIEGWKEQSLAVGWNTPSYHNYRNLASLILA